MAIIQIDGISGTGKTTLAAELIRRRHAAIDADKAFGYFGNPNTGEPTDQEIQANWIWDLQKVQSLATSSSKETVFVCGGAMNQDKIKDIFSKRFMLCVDDDTLRQRILNRTNNAFGKNPNDLARQIEWNKTIVNQAKATGFIVVDATRPIKEVADSILSIVDNSAIQ